MNDLYLFYNNLNINKMEQFKEGSSIGKFIFLSDVFYKPCTPRKILVKCFCGKEFITRLTGIKSNKVNSCGCVRKEKLISRITKHNKSTTPEYTSWESMKHRCLNSNNKYYKNYGGRGITVCDEWLTFEGFFKDMGNKPEKNFSLDRIDVNKGYYKDNCRWASRYTQDRNRRDNIFIEHEGEKYILSDLAKKVNMHQQTLKARLLRGLPVDQAILKDFKYTRNYERIL